jgi:hypothetical protein
MHNNDNSALVVVSFILSVIGFICCFQSHSRLASTLRSVGGTLCLLGALLCSVLPYLGLLSGGTVIVLGLVNNAGWKR